MATLIPFPQLTAPPSRLKRCAYCGSALLLYDDDNDIRCLACARQLTGVSQAPRPERERPRQHIRGSNFNKLNKG